MFFKKDRMELLDSIRKCADAMQENNELLTRALTDRFPVPVETEPESKDVTVPALVEIAKACAEGIQASNSELARALTDCCTPAIVEETTPATVEESDEAKMTIARALNLCAVSVSQIIEYNDLRFMEQEYENILNNLNLEKMPSDEALLDVLKQILDVISFFRIQDGEKRMLEKEYQHKVKNAIWNAIPSPSILVSGGGSIVGLVASLVMTAGTSYMNYRKTKANINLEHERKMWELQRSAMEQLHGLRRQLFETSWRLVDTHHLDDKLRLSERQIQQFNVILMDENAVRRYERLEFIQDYFTAYSPFAYHLGSAALHAAVEVEKNKEYRNTFILKAAECFEAYTKSGDDLLRENPIYTQCTFEYFVALDYKEQYGLLSDGETPESIAAKKIELLNSVVERNYASLDAMQMCATAYIELKKYDEAVRLLNMLVNEDYNALANAQLLSVIYVDRMIAEGNFVGVSGGKYDRLVQRFTGKVLYPKPPAILNVDRNGLDNLFLFLRQKNLVDGFKQALSTYLSRKETEFNILWNSERYIADDLIDFFNDISSALNVFYSNIHNRIASALSEMLSKVEDRNNLYMDKQARLLHEEINFFAIMEKPITAAIEVFISNVLNVRSTDKLSPEDNKLNEFCTKNKLDVVSTDSEGSVERSSLESALTGVGADELRAIHNKAQEFLGICKSDEYSSEAMLDLQKQEVTISYREETPFVAYMRGYNINQYIARGETPIMLIEDRKHGFLGSYHDLLFTTDRVILFSSKSNSKTRELVIAREYSDANCDASKKAIFLSEEEKFDESGINYILLAKLMDELKRKALAWSTQGRATAPVFSVEKKVEEQYRIQLKRKPLLQKH